MIMWENIKYLILFEKRKQILYYLVACKIRDRKNWLKKKVYYYIGEEKKKKEGIKKK